MLLVIVHLIILAVCLIMKIFALNDTIIGWFFVVTSVPTVIAYIVSLKGISKEIKAIILVGFILRVLLVFVDVFITRLPDAAWDDDGFYKASLEVYGSNYEFFSQNVYGGVFPKVLSILYFFIGSSRFSIQYLNVIPFLLSAILFLKALDNFGISERTKKILISLLCFMPNSIQYNSILRRETIIELCIFCSIFNYSRWAKQPELKTAFWTVFFIALAAVFHTAFIIILPFLVAYFTLYNRKKHALSFSVSKISKVIILLICAIFVSVGFLSLWSNKFSSVNEIDDVYVIANRSRGGSAYLTNYDVSSFGQLVLFTPLKLFYFLFSPVPWMWRNIVDVASFMLDASIYIYLILKCRKLYKQSSARLMMVSFLVLACVFALGTFNSGTAIRHRFSLLPYLLVSYALVEEKKRGGTFDVNKNQMICKSEQEARR